MIILEIMLWILVAFAGFVLILYLIEPSLVALPISLIFKAFLRNPPFLDADREFPKHKLIEENWETIREELEIVLRNSQNIPKFHEMDSIQKYISDKDETPWRVFVFKAYDNWMEQNCEQAPKTTEILRQFPEITSAMFSILEGKKHIPPHYGFYKGVLRYHLGLIVPDDQPCYIINGGQKYTWKEGKGVLFDDTFRHEVWNESDHTRVVLFCDVYRERMPWLLRVLNRWVYQMRVKSKRLKKAVAKAEVPVTID